MYLLCRLFSISTNYKSDVLKKIFEGGLTLLAMTVVAFCGYFIKFVAVLLMARPFCVERSKNFI